MGYILELMLWTEKWIHKYLLPKSLRENVGNNSDVMHAITISLWLLLIAVLLYSGIQIFGSE